MATRVYSTEELILQDGKEVTVRPLNIGRLRRFMDCWESSRSISPEEGSDEENQQLTIFINCAGIALEHDFSERFEVKASPDEKKDGNVLSEKYREYLEDVLDLDTIYRIIEIAGGIKLTDPKEIAQEQARTLLGQS